MLETSSIELAKPKKCAVRVGDDSRAARDRSEIDGSAMDDIEVDGGEIRRNEVGKKSWKTSKSKKLSKSK